MRSAIALAGEDDRLEAAGTHRWMVSYADFVTLLFVLFMVLYAKAPRLAAVPTPTPAAHVRLDREAQKEPQPQPAPKLDTPGVAEPPPPQRLLDHLSRSFADMTASGHVVLIARKEGVVLEIADASLFASGTAQPAPRAHEMIDKIAAAFASGNNAVIVEGHTDNVPIKTSQYPSNWELSSARAASVVRALQERGISPQRLAASGLAQTRPRSSNGTEQGRSENRRVSLVVLNE